MTTEELLIPRWKVIADYPSSHYITGSILTRVTDCNYEFLDPNDYPAIFKKLEWWEERSIEELPEYLQETIDSKQVVYQVFEYHLWQGVVLIEDSPEVLFLENLQPSTKEEYEKQNLKT